MHERLLEAKSLKQIPGPRPDERDTENFVVGSFGRYVTDLGAGEAKSRRVLGQW